ncbi:DUF6660 family protein [Chitinophaga sp. Hz27]|uniref:DUF6660 family protein n=1 Tax=Chitinophaga sp. Hz27 TaxID=3347169 RepID=UPI0035E0B83B
MKLFVYIFSIYIVLLSCLPCNDAAAVNDQLKQELVHSTDTDHPHSQPDFCSPLCICSCCNVQVMPVTIHTYVPYHISSSHIFPSFQSDLYTARSMDVWQPPRTVIG